MTCISRRRVGSLLVALVVVVGAGCSDTNSTMGDNSPIFPGPSSTLGDTGVGSPAQDAGAVSPAADAGARAPAPASDSGAPVLSGGPSAAADASTGGDATAANPPSAEAGSPAGGSILPPVDSVDGDGPFETTIDMGSDNWVFRPRDLGKDGLKHPVFVWGTGATAVPSQYTDHFTRMASHGFVIVAPTPAFLTADDMKASLDWILAENERMGSNYYQKLDPERVAMGGHSQGSTSTFDAEANETRLKTTLHIAGGSFDGMGSSKVKTPTAYICGETDIALDNCKQDFQNVGDQPTFFSVLAGVDHIQCARQALPGMIAWLRWHLAGEVERKAQFTGPDGTFFQGMWGSQTKNWD